MSIHTLTCDEFMLLDQHHHRTAVRLYSAEIDALIERLAAAPDKQSAAYAADSDELGRLLTLRKVHQGRLAELQDEEKQPAPQLTSEQYLQNELTPAR